MNGVTDRAGQLRQQIAQAEAELHALKEQLAQVESEEKRDLETNLVNGEEATWKWPLSAAEYDRYGRQLIVPQVGIHGQSRLKSASVLIVGAGGLGCPAAAYLAGAGVGTLGVVDGDVVEVSNLHRQIAHKTSTVGTWKVDSLISYCKALNPLPRYVPHREHLTPENAETIMRDYDIVLDCTDHPTSRYLISDACVLLQKTLVSASALRTDGQLIVLNTPPTPQGILEISSDAAASPANHDNKQDQNLQEMKPAPPCYRCVFPRPPPPDATMSCGEGGVVGPAVGVMGVLQALEAIKVVAAGLHVPQETTTDPTSGTASSRATMAPPTLLLFSGGAAIGSPTFRSVRMRPRRKACLACGDSENKLTLEGLRHGGVDYVAFCGGSVARTVGLLSETERISARDWRDGKVSLLGTGAKTEGELQSLLLDVREKELFDVACVDGAVNVPFSRIRRSAAAAKGRSSGVAEGADEDGKDVMPEWLPPDLPEDAPICVVCRVGNDSQIVAKELIDAGVGRGGKRWIGDMRGGMRAWRDEVDATLPFL